MLKSQPLVLAFEWLCHLGFQPMAQAAQSPTEMPSVEAKVKRRGFSQWASQDAEVLPITKSISSISSTETTTSIDSESAVASCDAILAAWRSRVAISSKRHRIFQWICHGFPHEDR
eukprot:s2202_g8.t1